MNNFEDLYNKYNQEITRKNIYSVDQLKNIILLDNYFLNLDLDEQEVMIETLTDSINEQNTIKEKTEIVNENINAKQYNNIRTEPMKKTLYSGYAFGSKSNSIPKTNSGFQFKKNISCNFIIKDPNDNSEGSLMSSSDKAVSITVINEDLYLKRKKQFQQLKLIKSPAQRTKPWFAMRNKSITASDCGSTVGENKHEPVYNFIIKKVFGSTFGTNIFCYHGKKFENVVTLMYSLINDVIVEEFGLLGHPKYEFLAASPDGICSPYCRDGITPSPLVGRMIEIKCPFQRKILYTGKIKGEICPDYYWCQVQLQLECCDLDECDFVQCNIEEYETRADYLADVNKLCDYKSEKYGLERGVVIELMPTKLSENEYIQYELVNKTEDGDVKTTVHAIQPDSVYDKASFIYQPKLDMNREELDQWIITQLDELNSKPELKLNKIIYWRFIERNTTLILRDKKWFANNLATMRKIWAFVEVLRENAELAQEWKNWIDEQNKKFNEKIINKLIELIKNKGLWEKIISSIKNLDVELSEELETMIQKPNEQLNNINCIVNVQQNKTIDEVNELNDEIIISGTSLKMTKNDTIDYQELVETTEILKINEKVNTNTEIELTVKKVKKERKPRIKKSESSTEEKLKKSNSKKIVDNDNMEKLKIFKSIIIDLSDEDK